MTERTQKASPAATRLMRGGLGLQNAARANQTNANTRRMSVSMAVPHRVGCKNRPAGLGRAICRKVTLSEEVPSFD